MSRNPQEFYKKFGVDKLVARKKSIYTKNELIYLKKYLNKKQKILDVGCGYGRFTIPLAKGGYDIQGLDISKNLLDEARKRARKYKLNVRFKLGDMRKLPYENNYFDSIICMWSAFTELPNKKDCLKALREMLRVLKKNGFAFLEMSETKKLDNRAVFTLIEGVKSSPTKNQNKKTMSDLMRLINPSKYKLFVNDFGGRKRLLVVFWK